MLMTNHTKKETAARHLLIKAILVVLCQSLGLFNFVIR